MRSVNEEGKKTRHHDNNTHLGATDAFVSNAFAQSRRRLYYPGGRDATFESLAKEELFVLYLFLTLFEKRKRNVFYGDTETLHTAYTHNLTAVSSLYSRNQKPI